MSANDRYREDLAWIHDVGFGGFAREAAPGVLELLRRSGVAGRTVLDLGCGSGIWAGRLCAAGYSVHGVDISPAMTELARKNAPGAEFRCGSFLSVELPSCDAVTSLGECLSYTMDPQNDRRGLPRLFRRVHAALRPGGVLIFDVCGEGYAGPSGRYERWSEGDGWATLVRVGEDRRRRTLERECVTFRRIGKHYRRDREVHRQNLYRGPELCKELRKIGFTARVVRKYGDLPLGKNVGIVARKTR